MAARRFAADTDVASEKTKAERAMAERWTRVSEYHLAGTHLRIVPERETGMWFVVDVRYPGKCIGGGALPRSEAKRVAERHVAKFPDRARRGPNAD